VTRIIKYFLENPIVGNMLMIAIFLLGFMGFLNMKSTLLPELDARLITIQLIYPGSSPEEVEEGIVSKIEENLKGLTGIERYTSLSQENSGLISINVLKGFDTDLILRDVKNAVDQINSFPQDMEAPIIAKQEYQGFAINFALSGAVDLQTLKERSRQVEKELLGIDGISKIRIEGFPAEEIEISFRETDLRQYQLTFDQAVSQIRSANLEVTGGRIISDREEMQIRARNKKYIAQDLREIVLKSSESGGVIRLHQVADIKDQWEDSPNRSYLNGEKAVVITVFNTIREDMLDITTDIRNYVKQYNQQHSVIKATIIQDASDTLNERISLMTDNGILGFILVVLLLALFLNWRLAFWVALAIPISFAGTFIFLGHLGVTINLMSLFGMIIVIGILVDDGIVIAENIFQKYEEGMEPMKAALEGTMEVLPAVFSAIVTTAVAFSGFFFVDGSLGEFGIELAVVVIISIAFSLLEGAFILPAHVAHSNALRTGKHKPNKLLRLFNGLMSFLGEKAYKPVLQFAMNYSFPMIAICIASLALVIGAFNGGVIRSTFFPAIPSERFIVDLKLPAGTREARTNEILAKIEAVAWELNAELSSPTGRYQSFGFKGNQDVFQKLVRSIGPTPNVGSLTCFLIPNEQRGDLSARDLTAILRERVGPVYEAESLQYRIRSAFGKPVDISLLGSNYAQLEKATQAVEAELRMIPDLRDVFNNNKEGLKEVNIDLKPQAYNLGLTLGEVIRQVRQGFFGGEVQRLQRGTDEVRVWVRYQAADRSDIAALADMQIRSPSGLTVSLEEIATFSIERGVSKITHLDGKREVNIEAAVVDNKVSVTDVLAQIRDSIMPDILAQYPNVEVSYNGESREQEKTLASMKGTVMIILLLIFFIIALTFKSISQTLVVFIIIPFGFVGVGIGHYWMDLPISMVSLLGFIALIGVLVNDALVFVTTFNDKIKKGILFEEALYATGMARFRPIILTSVTTIAGLLPILLEKSLGAQLLIPMAVSMAFGLMIVTVIILAMVPALLNISNGIKVGAMSVWEGKAFSRTLVEPAATQRQQNLVIVAIGGILAVAVFAGLILLAIKLAEMLF